MVPEFLQKKMDSEIEEAADYWQMIIITIEMLKSVKKKMQTQDSFNWETFPEGTQFRLLTARNVSRRPSRNSAFLNSTLLPSGYNPFLRRQ